MNAKEKKMLTHQPKYGVPNKACGLKVNKYLQQQTCLLNCGYYIPCCSHYSIKIVIQLELFIPTISTSTCIDGLSILERSSMQQKPFAFSTTLKFDKQRIWLDIVLITIRCFLLYVYDKVQLYLWCQKPRIRVLLLYFVCY